MKNIMILLRLLLEILLFIVLLPIIMLICMSFLIVYIYVGRDLGYDTRKSISIFMKQIKDGLLMNKDFIINGL